MRHQLLLQDTAGLDEQALVDRLVRHLMGLVVRVRATEPPGNLLGRPLRLQPVCNNRSQMPMRLELARLGTQGTIPGTLVRCRRPVAALSAVGLSLAADRRGRASQSGGDRPQRGACRKPTRYLLALRQAQRRSRPPARRRPDAAVRPQMRKIDDEALPNTRPIDFRPWPRCANHKFGDRCSSATFWE